MTFFYRKVTIVPHTKHHSKIAAVAAIDATFANKLGFEKVPLYKKDSAMLSMRELAKRHGSLQGELLEVSQLASMLSDLGYEYDLVDCESYTVFKSSIEAQLQQDTLVIGFFKVEHENGSYGKKYDIESEVAAIIHGINTETGVLNVTYHDKERAFSVRDFYQATSVLPEERKPEYYIPCSTFGEKYQLAKTQGDSSLVNESAKKSITPVPRSGFQKKLFIIKSPSLNTEAHHVFLQKRVSLFKNNVFSQRQQSLVFEDLIQLISSYQLKISIDEPKKERIASEIHIALSGYSDLYGSIKQEILDELIREEPDFYKITAQLSELYLSSQAPKTLSQSGCFKRLRAAGYLIESGGQCYGMSAMTLQAFLAGEMDKLVERLNRIQHLPVMLFRDDFGGLKQHIQELIEQGKRDESIAKQQEYIDIRSFFDGITLYQTPGSYRELHSSNTLLKQTQAPNQALLMPAVFSSQKKLFKIYLSIGAYGKRELNIFLKLLKNHLGNHFFGLHIHSTTHSMNLNYDTEREQWLLIDPNNLPGHRYIHTETLVAHLFSGFFEKGQTLLMSTELYIFANCSKHIKTDLKKLKQDAKWIMLHQESTEYYNRANTQGHTLLTIYFQYHLIDKVKHMLKNGAKVDRSTLIDVLIYFGNDRSIMDTVYQSSGGAHGLMKAACESGFFYAIRRVFNKYHILPDIKSLQHLFRKNSEQAIKAIEFFIKNKSVHDPDFEKLFADAAYSKQHHLAYSFIKAGANPDDSVICGLINTNNIKALMLLKNKNFSFKPEHFDDACRRNPSDIVPELFSFLLDCKIVPSEAVIQRLIRQNQTEMLSILRRKGYTFKPEHFDYACQQNHTDIAPELFLLLLGNQALAPFKSEYVELTSKTLQESIELPVSIDFHLSKTEQIHYPNYNQERQTSRLCKLPFFSSNSTKPTKENKEKTPNNNWKSG